MHGGRNGQERFGELFGTASKPVGKIGPRVNPGEVEARVHRALPEAGHHQEECQPSRQVDGSGQAGCLR